MYLKTQFINELNNGPRGVTFSTGTPLSNSVCEMYVMQTYLQRDELERLGMNHFDNWSANFGEVVSALELAPSGQGYRLKDRFSEKDKLTQSILCDLSTPKNGRSFSMKPGICS